MTTKKRILVTGSAGRIGLAVVAELVNRGHDVVGLDLRETPGLPAGSYFVGSVSDGPLLKWLAHNTDCVIHLAATPDDAKDAAGRILFDADSFLGGLVPNNLQGTYAVLEAVRASRGKRVILASSGQVIDGHLPDDYASGTVPTAVTAASLFQPQYLYSCTKVFLEAMGQVYARHHAVNAIAVRLGWCPRDAGQVAQLDADPVCHDVYLSPGDAGRFFAACVEAVTLPPYAVLYATSRPVRHTLYDLTDAKTLTGWEPRDTWPEGI